MRKMNDKAQWQLIEVILVAGMLFAAMYLVRSANVTVYKSIEEENPLKTQAYEALESIASQPAPKGKDNHNLLSYWAEENWELSSVNNFKEEIKRFFPSESNIDFNVTKVNITKSKEEGLSLEECSITINSEEYWIKSGSCSASRIVVVDKPSEPNGKDYVYKIILSLWYNT